METPSSTTRRVTRSQALTSAINFNLNSNLPMSKESEKGVSKSKPRTGALTDITNDSPIVGLAMGKLETPSSEISKKKMNPKLKDNFTPGSGESLLRGQAKTLLQKVDEESENSKVFLENKQFLKPSDTQINGCFADLVVALPVHEELMGTQEGFQYDKNMITRSLLFDFSEKSEGSDSSKCSSVLTNDDSSVWSLQVNTSTGDANELEEFENNNTEENEDFDYSDYDEEEEVDNDDGGLIDELCEGINKISVNVAKFEGKHTRFVYNSDDEIEREDECGLENEESPKGKHLRFLEDN